jgi:hypothetical protein
MSTRGRRPGFIMSEEHRYSVYVIGPVYGNGRQRETRRGVTPVKIGYAREPKRRLVSLQIGAYEQFSILFERDLLTAEEAKRIERVVHNKFKDAHIRGEWFNLSASTAAREIDKNIKTPAYVARGLMKLAIGPYIGPEKYSKINEVSLRTMDNNAVCEG